MARGSDRRVHERETRMSCGPDWRAEPDVAALLAEPIVRLMMARDGISPQQVMTLVHRLGARHGAVSGKAEDSTLRGQ